MLYLCKMSPEITSDRLRALLPPQATQRVAGYKIEADMLRSAAVWLLLDYALRDNKLEPLSQREIACGERGKPFFPGESNIQFSVSHSGMMAALRHRGPPIGRRY